MIRSIFISALLLTSTMAAAAPTINDIHRLLDEVHYVVDQLRPPAEDLAILESSLRADLDLLNNRTVRLLCLKSENGRYYPSHPATGGIVGDPDYSAGHSVAADCKATLPTGSSSLTCFKRANGRYFPTNAQTGAILGSAAYAAGYSVLVDCLASLK